MSAAPTVHSASHTLRETPTSQALPATGGSFILRFVELFWLCREIACYTDSDRKPPRALLDELGIRVDD
jgi:hypothetical protein